MNEGQKVLRVELVTNEQAATILQPRVAPLHFPTTLQTASDTAILSRRALPVLPMGCNHLDSQLSQLFIQRIAVVSFISSETLWLLLYETFFNGRLNKTRLMSICTIKMNSNRNPMTIDDQLQSASRPFSTLTDFFTPPLAGMNVPSMKHSDKSSFNSFVSAFRAAKRMPSRLQVCRYRCAVWKATKPSALGRSFQPAPVWRIQRIELRTCR